MTTEKQSLMTPVNIITAIILAIGLYITVLRFTGGLSAVTNLDQNNPWGIWIGFDLLCGVAGTLAQAMVSPASMVPNLGASGAIAGVLGAYLVLYPGASVLTLIPIFFFVELARLPAVLVIGFWFVLQLGSGLAALGAGMMESGGVAWFAHIGGFVTGVVLMLPLALQTRRRGSQGRAKTSR